MLGSKILVATLFISLIFASNSALAKDEDKALTGFRVSKSQDNNYLISSVYQSMSIDGLFLDDLVILSKQPGGMVLVKKILENEYDFQCLVDHKANKGPVVTQIYLSSEVDMENIKKKLLDAYKIRSHSRISPSAPRRPAKDLIFAGLGAEDYQLSGSGCEIDKSSLKNSYVTTSGRQGTK